MMGRLVEIKVWKEIVVPLFVCLILSVGNGELEYDENSNITEGIESKLNEGE